MLLTAEMWYLLNMESFVSFTWRALVIFCCCNKIPNSLIKSLFINNLYCSLGTLICFFLLIRALWLSHDVRYQSGNVCQRDRSEVRQTRARLALRSPVLPVSDRPGFLESCTHVLCGRRHSDMLSAHRALLLKALSCQHCHSGDETPSHLCQVTHSFLSTPEQSSFPPWCHLSGKYRPLNKRKAKFRSCS